jgi:hypothetical protein
MPTPTLTLSLPLEQAQELLALFNLGTGRLRTSFSPAGAVKVSEDLRQNLVVLDDRVDEALRPQPDRYYVQHWAMERTGTLHLTASASYGIDLADDGDHPEGIALPGEVFRVGKFARAYEAGQRTRQGVA